MVENHQPRCAHLGVVLKHLVALHVMALQHHDGAVETGHVQAEVIRTDLLVGRVREHLRRTHGRTVWNSSGWYGGVVAVLEVRFRDDERLGHNMSPLHT